jgi:hypothetical protein
MARAGVIDVVAAAAVVAKAAVDKAAADKTDRAVVKTGTSRA